jgi:hypothetical protein
MIGKGCSEELDQKKQASGYMIQVKYMGIM